MTYPCELTCIICNRELDSIMGPSEFDEGHTPYNGTIFTTYGHYGSTIFDEMGESRLCLTICDPCIVEKSKLILLSKGKNTYKDNEQFKTHTYEPFEISKRASDWVDKASYSIMLSKSLPIRTMVDGTTLEYIKHSSEGIHIKIDEQEKIFTKEKDYFITKNGDKYIVQWLVLDNEKSPEGSIISFNREEVEYDEE